MKCKNCGCENPDENTHCDVCGTEFEKNNNSSTNNINSENKSTDKSKMVIISLIIAIVTVIIISAVVAVSLIHDKDAEYNNVHNESVYDSTENSSTENTDYIEEFNTISNITTTTKTTTTTEAETEATTVSQKELDRKKALDFIKKANAALKNKEREGALQMADAALDLCDDSDIKKQYDKIYKYAPFKLYDEDNMLQVEHSSNYLTMSSIKSNDQTEMKNCLVIFYNWTDDDDPIQKITYNLKGNYDVISGTEFIDNSTKIIEQEGYFEIFGDGEKLYTSQTFKPAVLPKEFKINVSNIDILTVVFHGHTDHWDPMCNAAGYSISNFVALKNLP